MANALKEIDHLRALIAYRCTRDDIREINEPLKKDIADLRAAVDALDAAFQVEGKVPNGTGPMTEGGMTTKG
jgi:hypothetical protein